LSAYNSLWPVYVISFFLLFFFRSSSTHKV